MTTWLSKMLKRILKPPSQSFFLLGPRGTGKSTWLQALFPDTHVIDVFPFDHFAGLLAENYLRKSGQ
jgi:predicted AAA+ superfamily ATPase